ncbi:MAG: DUF6273 domain-containing protein [Treponema sp.]|nr:DUF6273 domain-containing protein [Treponema sp.]
MKNNVIIRGFLCLLSLCLGFTACSLDQAPENQTPGNETPGSETPGNETPGTETPGNETPGTETPGNETPGTETPENPKVVASGQKILFLFPSEETLSYTIDPGLSTGERVKSWASSVPKTAGVQNGVVSALAPGRAVITMTTMANIKSVWDVTVLDTDPPNLKTKFGVSAAGVAGVKATLDALHEYLPLLPDPSLLVKLGDYIDLDFSIPPIGDNDDYHALSGGRALVVGVNPFLGKNGNDDTPHIALHFTTVYAIGRMNLTATNAGGYKESAMRQYLLDHFLPALTSAGVTSDRIYAPKRYLWNAAAGAAGAADCIEDPVWLPTIYEIFGQDYIPVDYTATGQIPLSIHEDAKNQIHLEYYDTPAQRRKPGLSGAGASWWLASPSLGKVEFDTNKFYETSVVGGQDSLTALNPTNQYGVVPVFCVR